MLSFSDKLQRYAELLVRVGVNLQPGGKLHVNAPLESAELVRLVARKAYEAGAVHVDVRYSDQQLVRVFHETAADDALDYYPAWGAQESLNKIADGYAFLTIMGSDPDLLAGMDPARVARHANTTARGGRPVSEQMASFAVNWSIGAMPVPSWARKVFPDLSERDAVAKLWDAIFSVTRADRDDPVGAWRAHLADLSARREHLNARQYSALHFEGPGTDLMVGLADGHVWVGGEWPARNGVPGVPNLPTDEVFTAPHRERVDGVVRASKPLSVRGTLIDGIEVRFKAGRVVDARASHGEETLLSLLETDEGARALGEVALVPVSAPVARTGLLFLNTLFDENAASHIALGRAYPFNVQGGAERAALAGANDSLIHVDWMIGTPDTTVTGVTASGEREVLMRGGEWAFQ